MDFTKYLDIYSKYGLGIVFIGILYLGYEKTWVWGSELKDEQARTATALAERDKWQNLALQGTKLASDGAMRISGYKISPSSVSVESNVSPEDLQQELNRIKSVVHPGMEDQK